MSVWNNAQYTALYNALNSGGLQIGSQPISRSTGFSWTNPTGVTDVTGLGFMGANGKPIGSFGGTMTALGNGQYALSIPDPSGGQLHVTLATDPKTGMVTTTGNALQAPGGTTYTGGSSGGVLGGFMSALTPAVKALAPVALAGLGGAALAGAFAPAAAGAAATDAAATGAGTAATGAGLSSVPAVTSADIASALPGSISITGGSSVADSALGSMANLAPVAGGGLDTAAAAGANAVSPGLTAAEQAMVNSAPADLAASGAYAPGGTGFDSVVQGTTGLTGSATGNAAGTSLSDIFNGIKTAKSAYDAVTQAMNPQQYGASGGPGLYAQPSQPTTITNGARQTINTEPQYTAYNIVPQTQTNTGNLLSGLEYGLSTKPYGYRSGGEVEDDDAADDHNPLFITGKTGHYVDGGGDGQSDSIPARLADGEYVIDAETVAALGNGSSKAGARALDGMRKAIRAHKRSAPINKIPPPSKSVWQYMEHGLKHTRSR